MPEPDGRSRGELATRLENLNVPGVQHGEVVCDVYMRDLGTGPGSLEALPSPTDVLFATVFQVQHFSPVMHHVHNANLVSSSR